MKPNDDFYMTLILAVACTAAIVMIMLVTQAAFAADEFYADGTCVSDAGDPGFWSVDEDCITAARYDELMSVDALSDVPLIVDPSQNVADAYDLDPAVSASQRPLGAGLVEETLSYAELVSRAAVV